MPRTVRPSVLMSGLVLVAACLAAGCDVTVGLDSARYLEREKKDFQVSGTPDLVLNTFDGSIEIRSWDRPEVSVEIEKRGANKRAVDEIKVTSAQAGNRITIEVKPPDDRHIRIGFSMSRSARLIVSVPRETNIEARSGDGAISIDRVTGRLQLNTGDGSIKVVDTAGELRVHTGDGTVSLEGADGRLDIETGDGSVALDGKLEALRLRTGDGTVRVRAENGSKMTDDWEIRSGDGSVRLELPEPFDAELDAHSGDGRVSVSDLTVKGEVSRNAVRGQLGAGGRSLRVIASGDGSIRISKS
jgi:DUF4097 and DUF4098 domain-containing protein YvlB